MKAINEIYDKYKDKLINHVEYECPFLKSMVKLADVDNIDEFYDEYARAIKMSLDFYKYDGIYKYLYNVKVSRITKILTVVFVVNDIVIEVLIPDVDTVYDIHRIINLLSNKFMSKFIHNPHDNFDKNKLKLCRHEISIDVRDPEFYSTTMQGEVSDIHAVSLWVGIDKPASIFEIPGSDFITSVVLESIKQDERFSEFGLVPELVSPNSDAVIINGVIVKDCLTKTTDEIFELVSQQTSSENKTELKKEKNKMSDKQKIINEKTNESNFKKSIKVLSSYNDLYDKIEKINSDFIKITLVDGEVIIVDCKTNEWYRKEK